MDKFFNDSSTLIIAEVGQAHDGSLGMAHSYIDAAHKAGADVIKFQTHFANQESTLDDQFRINFSFQDKSRYDYWKRMEFTKYQWQGLIDHAHELGLKFISSAFSRYAVDVLKEINVDAWKISSGEIESYELLEAMSSHNVPYLISTGMSDLDEIESTILYLKTLGVEDICLLQCTSEYPTRLQDVGLNVMGEYKSRFNVRVGLSDHSGTIHPGLNVIAKNESVIECHVVFDKTMFGPDVSSSITFNELELLSEFRNATQIMNAHLIDKNKVSEKYRKIKKLFTKSYTLKEDTKKDTVITLDMLTLKKPGTGITKDNSHLIVGKKLKRDLTSNVLITLDDIYE